jgi:hypothetical protein
VGGARPPPFITFTLTSKVAVYAPAVWADTLTLFHLYQYMYSVVSIFSVCFYSSASISMVINMQEDWRAAMRRIAEAHDLQPTAERIEY